jgi:hypothetical protein
VSGQSSLELALLMKKKEREKERKKNSYDQTSGSDMYNCFDE